VLFDEIDAALDTQKVRALAEHVRARAAGQTVFVSHRKELIEASGRLVGTFMVDGGTRAVSVPFGA
jgi:chromosome segregation ATPase